MRLIPILSIVIFLTSCSGNNNEQKNNVPVIQTTGILDTSLVISDSAHSQLNKIDTFQYATLPYWKEGMDRFMSAYIDTFSINGHLFRFINPQADKERLDVAVYLEKYVNGKWLYTDFTLGTMNHVYDFYHDKDINGDGFTDITQELKWNRRVYFYNPSMQCFESNADWRLYPDYYNNNEWVLIDTTNKIFCDFAEGKTMCGDIRSTLYTFDGFEKKTLYDLLLDNCINENQDSVYQLVLNKVIPRQAKKANQEFLSDSLVEVKRIPLPTPINLSAPYDENKGYFDYAAFWQDHYRDLLGYK